MGLTETASQGTSAPNHAAPEPSLRTGELLDHYRVLGRLGVGGMGEVYEALDLGLDRRVALKVIRQGTNDPEQRRRFLREARAMAKLSHPNVVAVHEVGSDEGIDFIAMALVDGTDLSRWRDRPRRWQEVVAVYLEAGHGLAAAHACGMVHRDFKPSNVLLAVDGRVVVTDFGLAKLAHDQLEPATHGMLTRDDAAPRDQLCTLTAYGTVVGTPAFMAPELLGGQPATPSSDQYAFCAALYRTLTGQCPRGMSWDEVGVAVQERRAITWPIPAPPRWLRRVVERGLSIHPGQRFPSMEQVLRMLDPGRRLRRWLAMAGGLALTGVAAVSVARPWDPPAALPCGVAPGELETGWSPQVLASARSIVTVPTFELPAMLVSEAGASLDAYAAALREGYDRACAPPNPAALACLDQRRERLRLVTEGLGRDDVLEVERALVAIRTLPRVDACLHGGGYDDTPQPGDPGAARQVEDLRLELARIEASIDARRLLEALPRAERAVADARGLAYPPVLAEALALAGEAQLFAHHFPAARASLHEATLVAEEARLEVVLARALVSLAEVLARSSLDVAETEEVFRRAEAALERIGRPPTWVAQLEVCRAHAAGGGDAAIAQLEAAFEHYREAPDHSRMRAVDIGLGLAMAYSRGGRFGEALRLHEWVLAEGRALLGPHHPDIWFLTNLLADSLGKVGRYDEARHALDAVDDGWRNGRTRQQLELYFGENVRPDTHTRSVAVRVLDPEGRPVPRAELVSATWLFANGKHLFGGTAEWRYLEQPVRVWTDAEGRATLEGITDERAVMVAAEHDVGGRSLPVDLPPGQTPAEVVLSLRPWGGLQGAFEVTIEAGDAWPLRSVMIAPVEVAEPRRAQAEVMAHDGRYGFERIPAGRYNVYFVMEGLRNDVLTVRRQADVLPGATTELSWRDVLPRRDLEVVLDPGDGPWPAEAQLFLTAGDQGIETSPELDQFLPVALERGTMQLATIAGKETARLLRLSAGPHTLCAYLTWDEQIDPQRLFGLLRLEHRMVCRPLEIDPNAAPQRFVVALDGP